MIIFELNQYPKQILTTERFRKCNSLIVYATTIREVELLTTKLGMRLRLDNPIKIEPYHGSLVVFMLIFMS